MLTIYGMEVLMSNNLRSANEVLGNYQVAVYQYNNPYVSEFINLQPIRNIYIHASQLSRDGKVTSRGTLYTEPQAECTQSRRKGIRPKPL